MCTPCLENCIGRDVNECSVCNKTFETTSAEDIPVNTTLENVIGYVSKLKLYYSQAKESILTEAQKEINHHDSTISTMEILVDEMKNKVRRKEVEIKILRKEIDEYNKNRDEVLNEICENKVMRDQIKEYIEKINTPGEDMPKLEEKIKTSKEHLECIAEKYATEPPFLRQNMTEEERKDLNKNMHDSGRYTKIQKVTAALEAGADMNYRWDYSG
ncbi:unnamed protein product, partial [Meganyctiphanes norvegica]